MRVLAFINEQPDPFVPDLPTTTSQGSDISFPLVFTVYGPGDMDPQAVEAFDAVLAEMEADPEYLAALERASQVPRSEEHTSELQSLMRISYAVFCLKKKKKT